MTSRNPNLNSVKSEDSIEPTKAHIAVQVAIVKWIGVAVKCGNTGCEFYPRCDCCFKSLTDLGKLLTPNVHPLDQGDEWVTGL